MEGSHNGHMRIDGPLCSDEHTLLRSIVDGVIDLGYTAGRIDNVSEKILTKRMKGEPVTKNDRHELAKLLCNISPELNAKSWHRPHNEVKLMYSRILETQLWGHNPEALCSLAAAGEDNDEAFEQALWAAKEISDMITEPCGLNHAGAVVGCAILGDNDNCDSLGLWKQIRDDAAESHHKARTTKEMVDKVHTE